MARKRKGEPVDPELAAELEAAQERYRAMEAERRALPATGTVMANGHTVRAGLDPDTGPILPTPRHAHGETCLGEPYREQVMGGWWWMVRCKVVGAVGLRPVSPNDGDRPGPMPSWWAEAKR